MMIKDALSSCGPFCRFVFVLEGKIDMESENTTIIICCAGMGTRLGIGTTKTLVKIAGKSIIQYQLEMLNCYDDIRIVVGYQAEKVIDEAKRIRNDVMFAFNNEYRNTGAGASLSKALIGARKYVVIMDGDLLINEEDFKRFMEIPNECISVCKSHSSEPIYLEVIDNKVYGFTNVIGEYEWGCISKVLSERLSYGTHGIDEMLQPLLPLEAISMRIRDLDTQDDYERMTQWFDAGRKE